MAGTHTRRRAGIVLGAAGAALAGSMMLAAPASAHTPNWSVDCSKVTVDLKWYSKKAPNTVTITADGKQLLSEQFGAGWNKTVDLPAHTSPIEVRVVVDASDDDRYDLDQTKTSPVCEGEETPAPTPTATPSESPAPSTEPTPEQSSSAPVEKPDENTPAPTEDLAETGSSSATPVIAGIAAAVVAAGAGLMIVARRRRGASQA